MQDPYLNLWMDQLGDPLTTRPIQSGLVFTSWPHPNWQFQFIDNLDRQFGNGLVETRTWTRSDCPEPLLTLNTVQIINPSIHLHVITPVFESHQTAIPVQWFDCLAAVYQLEMLIVLMWEINLLLESRWFVTYPLQIDWATCEYTALSAPSGKGEADWSGMLLLWCESWKDTSTNV